MAKPLLFSLLLFLQAHALAQEVKGRIRDASTKEVIPFAHIVLVNTHKGTVANQNGEFNFLLTDKKVAFIKVSSIGYKSQTIQINTKENREINICLIPAVTELLPFIVKAGNPARDLLEKAIDHIPLNYPAHDEILTAFIREVLSERTGDSDPIYIAEATIKAHKKTYKKQNKKGTVQLVQGRKYESPEIDSLKVRFYGALHDIHLDDFVKRRKGPLNKKIINNYELEIQDTTSFDQRTLVNISFSLLSSRPKKNVQKGNIFIDLSSFAIVRVEVNSYNPRKKIFDIVIKKRLPTKHITEYAYYKEDKRWRLKSSRFEGQILLKKHAGPDTVHIKADMVVTGFEDYQIPLPYNQTVLFRDPFLMSTGNYDPIFWKDYQTLSSTPLIDSLFKRPIPTVKRRSKTEKVLHFLKKIDFTYGITYASSNLNAIDIQYNHPAITLNSSLKGSTISSYNLASDISFNINPSFSISYTSINSIEQRKFLSNGLRLNYRHNLISPEKHPFYVALGLGVYSQRWGKSLGTIQPKNNFTLNKKKFDSERVRVFFERRSIQWGASFGLRYELNKRLRFAAGVQFRSELSGKRGVYFREKQFILKRKATFVRADNSKLTISSDKASLISTLLFNIGVNFSL